MTFTQSMTHSGSVTGVAPRARAANSPSPVRAGVLAMLPLLAGAVPLALVVGATVARHGDMLAGWSGSWLVFGGSAHVATLRTLDSSGAGIAIVTGLVVNTRLLVYSTSLARHWQGQPRWFRIASAGMIIDPSWAIAEQHAAECDDAATQRRHFLAAGFTLALAWTSMIAVGALLGAGFDWLNVDIVMPLALAGMLGQGLRVPTDRVVMGVAAATAYATRGFPNSTGMLVAVLAGIVAGAALPKADQR